MSSADNDAPPSPGLVGHIDTTSTILQALLTGVYRHYVVGPPAPSWSLVNSVASNVLRTKTLRQSRKDTANPPKSRQQLVTVPQEPNPMEKLTVKNDAMPGAIIKEIQVPVKKRELPGLLAELSRAETGTRTVPAEWTIPDALLQSSDSHVEPRSKVVLFCNGGAHIQMSPKTHRTLVVGICREFRCRTLSLDYRLSPGVQFPASTLDSVSAYLYLTEDLGISPSDIIIAGDSAGGNLSLTLMQYLRDSGLPQASAAYLLCPWCDLSTSFKASEANKNADYLTFGNYEDPYFPPRLCLASTYPATDESEAKFCADKVSPYVSQAVAPLDSLRGFPPMLVQSGGLEVLLAEETSLVRRIRLADEANDVTHQVWADGVHVFHVFQADRAGASALREAGKWYSRLLSDSSGSGEASATARERKPWEDELDGMLEREKQARIARSGPIKPAKPADSMWTWERSVERLADPVCKPDGHEVARKAAEEVREVTDKKAEAEVFRPLRA